MNHGDHANRGVKEHVAPSHAVAREIRPMFSTNNKLVHVLFATVSRGGSVFTHVKIFSATMVRERLALGERATEWLVAHPELRVVDKVVRQSSDDSFHCISIVLFLEENAPAPG